MRQLRLTWIPYQRTGVFSIVWTGHSTQLLWYSVMYHIQEYIQILHVSSTKSSFFPCTEALNSLLKDASSSYFTE